MIKTPSASLVYRMETGKPIEAAIEPPLSPPGLLTDLFNACLEVSTALADFIRRQRRALTGKQRARYTESHSRICLWRDNTLDGRLEICITRSSDLYQSILDLLCTLAQTYLKGISNAFDRRS